MAGRRTFQTLTSSQQSSIKSKHINTHITTKYTDSAGKEQDVNENY